MFCVSLYLSEFNFYLLPLNLGLCRRDSSLHLSRGASRRQLNQISGANPLDLGEQWLPEDWASHNVSKGKTRHAVQETHFGCLSLQFCFCDHRQTSTAPNQYSTKPPINLELPINVLLHFSVVHEQNTEILKLICFSWISSLVIITTKR